MNGFLAPVGQLFLHRAMSGVIYYRYGHWAFCQCRVPGWKHLHQVFYLLLLPFVRTLTSADFSYKASIGPGLIAVGKESGIDDRHRLHR